MATLTEAKPARYAILIGAAELSCGMQRSLVEFKDFLTSAAGGSWQEGEIMICGPMDWQLVQLLLARLSEYDFVLVYQCRFSHGAPDADWSGKLRSITDGKKQQHRPERDKPDVVDEMQRWLLVPRNVHCLR
ncbi:MAG: hypothetical protein J6K96_03430 [Treponema sp.]|nr:hypothetical protein [Treponema sp.]